MAYPWTAGEVVTATDLNAAIANAGTPGGSDGQIQYNNGGAFGGASALYYDDVNSRVGIGTTTPSELLDINAGTSGSVELSTTGGRTIQLTANDSEPYLSVGSTSSHSAAIMTNGVRRLTVDSSGNVGINDTTPSYTLDVNGTGRFTGDVITDDLTVNCSSTELKVQGSIAGVQFMDRDGDGQRFVIYNSGNILRFWNGSDRMEMDGSGNLSVDGTLSASSISTNTASVTLLNHSSTSSYDKIRVWNSGSYSIGMVSGITHGALNDYAMTFRMNSDNDRGFWWGDTSHGVNGGAMSLSTDGRLYVSTSVKCGYGETNTSNTFGYGLEVGGLTRVTQDGSSVYWYNQAITTAGNGQRAGLGLRNDGSNNSTVQLRPAGGYLYVRTWDDGTGVIMRAASYQNYSTMRDKQDVTDWGVSKSVGAAVDSAYAIDATEMVRNLRPVKFRRTKHHRLSADIQNHNERRGRALDRLNNLRRSKGLEEYHTDETVHQCGRDCEGSAESPCKLYRDWEKGEVGFIAEEVVNVVPDAVSTDDDEQPLTIDPMTLIATCVKALQEIDARLTSLEAS